MTVGFAGIMETGSLITTILTIWSVKVAYEILALPFSTRFVNWVKKIEGVDTIDKPTETKYNPFSTK